MENTKIGGGSVCDDTRKDYLGYKVLKIKSISRCDEARKLFHVKIAIGSIRMIADGVVRHLDDWFPSDRFSRNVMIGRGMEIKRQGRRRERKTPYKCTVNVNKEF
ncbi:hypothetical protein RUM44_009168 [Polyplax serrata]|uniref:Uncharacterized protein n=1 Tax=Polyplax serrata TaxID=468196 RepID=A0ABR1ARX6_POLSC